MQHVVAKLEYWSCVSTQEDLSSAFEMLLKISLVIWLHVTRGVYIITKMRISK